MKMSIVTLLLVASGLCYIATHATDAMLIKNPTSIITVPIDSTIKGGGFNIELPANLTEKQQRVLSIAYAVAEKDGHQYPQLLQGIILQESKAGGMKSYKVAGQEFGLKPNLRYYGVAQLKLVAARDVLAKWPELWDDFNFQSKTDEEVIAKLIENEEFNIAIASKYLLILQKQGFKNPNALATAYNRGATGARRVDDVNTYSDGVNKHIAAIITES